MLKSQRKAIYRHLKINFKYILNNHLYIKILIVLLTFKLNLEFIHKNPDTYIYMYPGV